MYLFNDGQKLAQRFNNWKDLKTHILRTASHLTLPSDESLKSMTNGQTHYFKGTTSRIEKVDGRTVNKQHTSDNAQYFMNRDRDKK